MCYRLLKEERRQNNDYHKRIHGSPSEWGKRVSKRLLEQHPLYSPSSTKKSRVFGRAGADDDDGVADVQDGIDTPDVPLVDTVEEMLREEVLQRLRSSAGDLPSESANANNNNANANVNNNGSSLSAADLCVCGSQLSVLSVQQMMQMHVLPCPHCGVGKCVECAQRSLRLVSSLSRCCDQCGHSCANCAERLRLRCQRCEEGRRCHGAGCGGVRCSTCFNQLCGECREKEQEELMQERKEKERQGKNQREEEDDDDDDGDGDDDNTRKRRKRRLDDFDDDDDDKNANDNDEPGTPGTGFEYFFCSVCQFRSCFECRRKNCYCAPATRHRAPDAIPTRVEGRSISYLFKKLSNMD